MSIRRLALRLALSRNIQDMYISYEGSTPILVMVQGMSDTTFQVAIDNITRQYERIDLYVDNCYQFQSEAIRVIPKIYLGTTYPFAIREGKAYYHYNPDSNTTKKIKLSFKVIVNYEHNYYDEVFIKVGKNWKFLPGKDIPYLTVQSILTNSVSGNIFEWEVKRIKEIVREGFVVTDETIEERVARLNFDALFYHLGVPNEDAVNSLIDFTAKI